MRVQWYPGHMHKAGKDIKALLPTIDIVIEILDARIPFSSENPMLTSLVGDKPRIKVLNKNDLADNNITAQWQTYLERDEQVKTLALQIGQQDQIKRIKDLCIQLLNDKKQQGHFIHALIMGIPNVGKSSLINKLAHKLIAKTGNEPAVTKNQQRIDIGSNVILFDTPGMLWPNIENQNSGFRLAVTGAIKDTAIDHTQIALFAADYLLNHYSDYLMTRYRLDPLPEHGLILLESIGRRRGCLKAGKTVDLDKAAKILLTELRSGLIGPISLETPGMVENELVELEIIRQQKAVKKLERKQKRQQISN